ncbi:MAG: hypothetical protein RML32_08515, partial [Gammaproteobacteria bacterium]|nr:hypothetical protein [Gammaproteobacteria bacterium]
MKRLIAALLLAGVAGWHSAALAQNTAAGTQINNRATVNYSVGGNPQTPIESSPTGNTVPGTGNGANTSFLVDDRVSHTVVALGSGTVVTPNSVNQVTAFSLTNTGNAPHAYALGVVNLTGGTVFGNTDTTDVTNLRTFVDANGNGTYESGVDTAVNVQSLAAGASVTVFVLADIPMTTSNGQFANVRLTARAAENNNPANP